MSCKRGYDKTPLQFALPTDYRLEIAENRDERKFEVKLISTTVRRLCINSAQWPNSLGQLHFARDRVYVTVGDTRYDIKTENFGYPAGFLEIPAGGGLDGFIAFDEFDSAWPTGSNTKPVLAFEVQPYYCK